MPQDQFLPIGDGESVDLVRQAQQGDADAMNVLFARYFDRIMYVVRLRLGRGVRRFLESADIVQETFAAAVQDFDRFEMRDESSLIHWLAKIAENKIRAAHDYQHAEKRDARREIPLQQLGGDSDVAAFEPSDGGMLPIDELVLSEDRAIIESLLDELRPEHREVIILRNYVGADWESIARILDFSSAAAARMCGTRAIVVLERLIQRRRSSNGELKD